MPFFFFFKQRTEYILTGENLAEFWDFEIGGRRYSLMSWQSTTFCPLVSRGRSLDIGYKIILNLTVKKSQQLLRFSVTGGLRVGGLGGKTLSFLNHGLQPTRLLHPWVFQARVLEWGAIAFSNGCSVRN